MSPSEFAKSIGWRSLKDCERFLGLGENSMGRTAKSNPVKFRAMVRGAWLESGQACKEAMASKTYDH